MLLKKATSALLELYMCTTSTLRYELVSAGRFFSFFLNLQTGQRGREVIWGEENSWLLFLSWFSSSGITDLFQPFFFSFAQTRSWRECCSAPSWMLPMYTISCAKSPSWKTKTDGFWRKREVGGDWSEGLKGTDGKWGENACWGECGEMEDTHGSCYYGCYMFHVWLSCSNFLGQPWSIQSLICHSRIKSNFAWGPNVFPN